MAEYDLLVKNGTIVDGTRMPAYRGDIGIRAGPQMTLVGQAQHAGRRSTRDCCDLLKGILAIELTEDGTFASKRV